ncbi:sugar/nucleoside kinase (ribokinase family) [Streptomyces sp. B4I13]|nr:hypothetical protein [Streptomyces sp. B4I13]MDQ0964186.1 sugar/nucleoside kinase (ribokinase family) [Streptomyces sp. B4I13]
MTDVVALGEVMLRFDPGEGRIRSSRTFQVWEGGGEYNVVQGLRRCFGLRTAVVTSLVDNAVDRLVEDLILQGGVDTSLIHGLLSGVEPWPGPLTTAGLERALVYGTAHGALAMTTPGDVSMASLAEVHALMEGGSAAVRR